MYLTNQQKVLQYKKSHTLEYIVEIQAPSGLLLLLLLRLLGHVSLLGRGLSRRADIELRLKLGCKLHGSSRVGHHPIGHHHGDNWRQDWSVLWLLLLPICCRRWLHLIITKHMEVPRTSGGIFPCWPSRTAAITS